MTERKQRNHVTIETGIKDILGTGLSNALSHAFNRMDIAEEEIAAAKERHPDQADAIHDAFRHLCPTEVLQEAGERLYRAHCREIIARVADGQELAPATDAETVAALSGMSQIQPLSRSQSLTYWKLFTRLFPADAETIRTNMEPIAASRWDRQHADELEARLRRRLRSDRKA